jgi:hypothetical protein
MQLLLTVNIFFQAGIIRTISLKLIQLETRMRLSKSMSFYLCNSWQPYDSCQKKHEWQAKQQPGRGVNWLKYWQNMHNIELRTHWHRPVQRMYVDILWYEASSAGSEQPFVGIRYSTIIRQQRITQLWQIWIISAGNQYVVIQATVTKWKQHIFLILIMTCECTLLTGVSKMLTTKSDSQRKSFSSMQVLCTAYAFCDKFYHRQSVQNWLNWSWPTRQT